jgi:hypothetical protein
MGKGDPVLVSEKYLRASCFIKDSINAFTRENVCIEP